MAKGKNKLLRYCRLYLDEWDLSGDSRMFSTLQSEMSDVDMTVWTDPVVKKSLADGYRMVGVMGYQALINDAAGHAHAELKDPLTSGARVVSLLLGGGGVPEAGDPAYIIGGAQMGDPRTFDAGAAIITADFKPSSQDTHNDQPFGVVLEPDTDLAATVKRNNR